MRWSFFYHSLVSDWNNASAHFLRGIVTELMVRGHEVCIYEPRDGWSRQNLLQEYGISPLSQFHRAYPRLQSALYDRSVLNLDKIAAESDVIVVHEWNEPWLVNAFGELRNRMQQGDNRQQQFILLFHDTHHRIVSDPQAIKQFRLEFYDGLLVGGEVLKQAYRGHGWQNAIWTWHEAADTRVFYPRPRNDGFPSGDLVWIGNWGDEERRNQLFEYLFEPVQTLGLSCNLYGVRYPANILENFLLQGIQYHGWLPNFFAPQVFANHQVAVHVPRNYYSDALPGVPTIRPFEALACGIPLVCSPWDDAEHLFSPGQDYLVANSSREMRQHLRDILNDDDYANSLAEHGLATLRERHTCVHRVDELLEIVAELQGDRSSITTLNTAAQSARLSEAAQDNRRFSDHVPM